MCRIRKCGDIAPMGAISPHFLILHIYGHENCIVKGKMMPDCGCEFFNFVLQSLKFK
jgi:hypothetical protein